MDATWHCPRAQYAGSTQSFVLNVEPQEIPKHGSLVNVSGMRGERKRMRRERFGGGERGGKEGERKGRGRGEEGERRGRGEWHTRMQSSTKIDSF